MYTRRIQEKSSYICIYIPMARDFRKLKCVSGARKYSIFRVHTRAQTT